MKKFFFLLFLAAAAQLLPPCAYSRSPRAACILDPGRGYMEASSEESWRVEHWRNQFRARGFETRIISGVRLERELSRCRVLVVPGARDLTGAQTSAVIEFIREGNSVILTGRAGEKRDGALPGSLAHELGLKYSDAPFDDEFSPRIILNTPSFFTSGILPGRLLFAAEMPDYTTLENWEGPAPGFWLGARGADGLAPRLEFPAMAASRYGRGGFFWMAPRVDSVGGDLGTSESFSKLVDNLLAWFFNEPAAEKNPWPGAFDKSIIFAQDTESGFANTLDLFEIDNLPPATFFILTDLAELNLRVFNRLAESPKAEIAVHGDSHDIFRGQAFEKQKERFLGILRFSEREGVRNVIGFRPPEEQYDHYTLKAMAETGFEYIFANDWMVAAAPRILDVDGYDLVQFPMFNSDDIKIIVERRLQDNALIFREYAEDIDRIFSLGGLYMFDFHSHVLTAERHIDVIRRVIDYIEPFNVWKTSCAGMSDWWKSRENVDFTVLEKGARSVQIEAVNRSEESSAGGLAFSVWFPGGAASARAETPAGERSPAGFHFRAERAVTVLPELRPGETFRFAVLWEE